MRERRLRDLEKRVEALPRKGRGGVIVYRDEEDKAEKLKRAREIKGDGTLVILPHNGRAPIEQFNEWLD